MPVYRLQFIRKTVDITGREMCRMFGAEEGHDDLSVVWWMLPPGCVTPAQAEEVTRAVIVLSGRGAATVEGRREDLAAGFSLYVPRGSAWSLENTGREPLVCYAVAAPAERAAGTPRAS
jgi:mannose-6-phosphate isomerase-like protein (cupin superfamily)